MLWWCEQCVNDGRVGTDERSKSGYIPLTRSFFFSVVLVGKCRATCICKARTVLYQALVPAIKEVSSFRKALLTQSTMARGGNSRLAEFCGDYCSSDQFQASSGETQTEKKGRFSGCGFEFNLYY